MDDVRSLRHELHDHARALAVRLRIAPDDAVSMADLLLRQYSRWPRRYHDGRHQLACVRAAEALRPVMPSSEAAAFALWFHDAVYWPWRHDNEARSADQARRAALHLRLGEDFAWQVHALVMATAHLAGEDGLASGALADWVIDIDLGILGAPPEHYERYERDVRREYFFVMPPAWRKGRRAVLRHFLDRPTIYRTTHFQARLEARARANLERALARLAD